MLFDSFPSSTSHKDQTSKSRLKRLTGSKFLDSTFNHSPLRIIVHWGHNALHDSSETGSRQENPRDPREHSSPEQKWEGSVWGGRKEEKTKT